MTIGAETALIIGFMVLYGYLSFSVQIIARRTDTPNDWFAWIPIVNIFLICMIAKKPLWWFLWLIVPLATLWFWSFSGCAWPKHATSQAGGAC